MKILKTVIVLTTLVITTSSNAALVSRLGGQAYYDEATNLTWLTDANYAQTSGYDSDGRMSYADANSWATSLSVSGVTYWHVSYAYGSCQKFDCNSQLSRLLFNTLENTDRTLTNTGPFINIQESRYWQSGGWGPDSSVQSFIEANSGYTSYTNENSELYAWAVYEGDVSAVPIPSAVWLFSSGLLGLVGVARRKKR